MQKIPKNLKSAPFIFLLIIALILLAGVIIVIGGLFRNPPTTLQPSNFLAAGGAVGSTQAVANIQLSAENYPSASFNALSSTQYTSSSLSCRDKAYKDNSAYETRLTKKGSCIANQVRAWLLGQKAGAAQTSITLIQTNIDSSREMIDKLNNSRNSFAFMIYPGGENTAPVYDAVLSPKILCLKDSADSSAVIPEIPIGPLTANPVNTFAATTNSQERELLEVKKKAQELADARAKKEKSMFQTGQDAKSLIDSLAGRFLAIDLAMAWWNHKTVLGRGIAVAVSANKTGFRECNPGFFVKHLAFTSGVKPSDKWFTTEVGVDNLLVTDCMPYEYLLRDAISGINKYIGKLETLKSGHVTALDSFNKQIKALRDNNYYCDAPVEEK